MLGLTSYVYPMSYYSEWHETPPVKVIFVENARFQFNVINSGWVGKDFSFELAGLAIRSERIYDIRMEDFPTWQTPNNVTWLHLTCPAWIWFLAVIVLAVYPTLVGYRRYRQHRRRRGGLCLQCGYNLTGNTSGICPECSSAQQSGGA